MTKRIEQHSCDICGTVYDTLEEAQKCEAKGLRKPSVQVGDIVFGTAGFGWYDGDRGWISNPDVPVRQKPCPNGDGNCFSECCTYRFYYVVTAIDLDDSGHLDSLHDRRYHLFTRAMTKGYRCGYTFDQHHVKPKKVADPPLDVVETSKALIGQKALALL